MSKGRRVPPKITLPDDDVTIRVCKADRQYFEQHSNATEYTRPYVPGEAPEPAVSVLVLQLSPGRRNRVFLDAHDMSRQGVIDYDPEGGYR